MHFFILKIQNNAIGDAWTYDGSRQQKFRNCNNGQRYGEYWNEGDIITCGLDLDNRTVQFWRNGQDMGVAFTDVQLGSGGRICPLVGIARRVKLQCNFGKDTFAFPMQGYNMLHSFLSEKEIEQLGKLFTKYRGKRIFVLCNDKIRCWKFSPKRGAERRNRGSTRYRAEG